jgi:hypothetical protein
MVRKGGSKTKGGLYWKKCEWEIVTVEGKNGTLPGTGDIEYLRIPGVLVAPLALIMGLAFYLFLPFIGFVMLLSVIAKKIWGGFAPAALQHHSDERGGDLHKPSVTSQPRHLHQGGSAS